MIEYTYLKGFDADWLKTETDKLSEDGWRLISTAGTSGYSITQGHVRSEFLVTFERVKPKKEDLE